jgi:hypothetical protein
MVLGRCDLPWYPANKLNKNSGLAAEFFNFALVFPPPSGRGEGNDIFAYSALLMGI